MCVKDAHLFQGLDVWGSLYPNPILSESDIFLVVAVLQPDLLLSDFVYLGIFLST